MKKILSSKAIQLLIIIIVAAVLSAVLTAVKTNEYSNWISTEAVITGWKTTRDVTHIMYFRYEVDETEYTGQDVFGGNFPENNMGDIVTVWYDPDDALSVRKSDLRPDAGLWTYVPFIFAVPISLIVLTVGYKTKTD